ncbi:MAG: oxidoreductase [Gammaproteobacteria bacterium]|nr:oxidoreductase [Gammaproteobacteria bacterium]
MKANVTDDFYIVAHEPGAEHPAIPTWASNTSNPVLLDADYCGDVQRIELRSVPAAFQILNLLSVAECRRIIQLSESLGYLQDAAVSLPRSIRHNDSFTWIADRQTNDLIWRRCSAVINQNLQVFDNKKALGLNARFRFYRYQTGDYFSPHTDGSWPGSEVIDNRLITNAYDDRWSQLTFLVFLSDDYEGGSTDFHVSANDSSADNIVSVKTPIGAAFCFPHGQHPLHCLHSSATITQGTKYIIRSDVLFEL